MRYLRVYVDTSVFGRLADVEFMKQPEAFFQAARGGRFRLSVSQSIIDEIEPAPKAVREKFASLYKCDGLVSWNFKHIVQPDKARHFNILNAAYGYSQLFLTTPEEIVRYAKEIP